MLCKLILVYVIDVFMFLMGFEEVFIFILLPFADPIRVTKIYFGDAFVR